jgi:predicted kinase
VTAEIPRRRPWLVLVTGEPGAGKSTLGRQLAGALRILYLSRDDVRWGLYATAGVWTDDVRVVPGRDDAVEAFLELIEKAAALGISAVLEIIVFRDRPETLARLRALADCLVVVATAADAADRADRRDRADPLLNRRPVLDALGHPSVESYIAGAGRDSVLAGMTTDLDLPILTVRTDDGYDPPLDRIVEWVIERTSEGHPIHR